MKKQKGMRLHEDDEEDEEEFDEFGNSSSFDQHGESKMDNEAMEGDDDEDGDSNSLTTTIEPIATTTIEDEVDMTEVTKENVVKLHHAPVSDLSPTKSLYVVPEVEIKSDGNSGHLNPGLSH